MEYRRLNNNVLRMLSLFAMHTAAHARRTRAQKPLLICPEGRHMCVLRGPTPDHARRNQSHLCCCNAQSQAQQQNCCGSLHVADAVCPVCLLGGARQGVCAKKQTPLEGSFNSGPCRVVLAPSEPIRRDPQPKCEPGCQSHGQTNHVWCRSKTAVRPRLYIDGIVILGALYEVLTWSPVIPEQRAVPHKHA